MTKPVKKYLVIDFNDGEAETYNSLDDVRKHIKCITDTEGQNADWAINNFLVYEIKERILFTAQEEISIKFGVE